MLPITISSFNHGKHVRSVRVRTPDTSGFNESVACNGLQQSPMDSLQQSDEGNQTKPTTVRLVYRFETEHYALWLFIDTLNRSDEFARQFVQRFAHLKCDRLRIKYHLTDTPVYPLLKGW